MIEPRPGSLRSLTCAACGAAFACTGDADCWCGDEPYRLPMPITTALEAAADCLCPRCLRARAARETP